jgi:hypothetical protein
MAHRGQRLKGGIEQLNVYDYGFPELRRAAYNHSHSTFADVDAHAVCDSHGSISRITVKRHWDAQQVPGLTPFRSILRARGECEVCGLHFNAL